MSEKLSSGVRAVSDLAIELREAIIELAGNRALFDTRDRWLDRAARAAGISRRMAKTFFYGEKCNPSAEVVAAVRSARDNLRIKDDNNVASAANEYRELLARIERLETALRIAGADKDCAGNHAGGGASRRSGGSVDQGGRR
jgi:hypothetical protein